MKKKTVKKKKSTTVKKPSKFGGLFDKIKRNKNTIKIKDKYAKPKKPSLFDDLFKELNINENYTQKEKYKFDKVKQTTYPVGGRNYMADLLMLPVTSKKNRYILSVIDIYSNRFDIEPLKSKAAKEVLNGLKTIFSRDYLKSTNLRSIRTDNGGEFKSEFESFLKNNKIAHLVNLPDRHSQLANVENLNRQLGRLFMTYLTHKSMELGKEYNDWDEIVEILRKGINAKKLHPKDKDPYTEPMATPKITTLPKYKEGDIVYRPLEKPAAYGKFRHGDIRYDLVPRKIKTVLLYPNNWRYILLGFDHVAYAEKELKPAVEKVEKWEVSKLIDKRTVKKQIQYLVWWKRYKKSESTWESKENLIEDGLEDMINDFEKSLKEKENN